MASEKDFQSTVSKIITTRNTVFAFRESAKFGRDKFCPTCLPTETLKGGQRHDREDCERRRAAIRGVFEGGQDSDEEKADDVDVNDDDDEEEEEEGEGRSSQPRSKKCSFKKLAKKVVQTQSVIHKVESTVTRNRVMVATKCKTISKVPVTGGTPMTEDLAVELRQRVFGNCALIGIAMGEWLGLPFCFQEAQNSQSSYMLKVIKPATRGYLMCIQGYILKRILFDRNARLKGRQWSYASSLESNLAATKATQEETIALALSEILWKAGDRKSAVFCLTGDDVYVRASERFQVDSCTEKVQIFQFQRQEDLYSCIKRFLYELICEGGNGILLSLYSLVLSRGLDRLMDDVGGDTALTMIEPSGCIHPCVATLMVAGRASKYLHNGIVYEGSEHAMAEMKIGILTRGEIGLLVWNRDDNSDSSSNAGSRLKTPSYPVWVTRCLDNNYGILFSPNKDLNRNYHAENKFDLYYYSSSRGHSSPTLINADTREKPNRDEYGSPALENLLRTKWGDADFDWNGTTPYV